jgi:hypothetical protein
MYMMSSDTDAWALCRRPPVVIPRDEAEGIERQWAIYANMSRAERLDVGLRMSHIALQQRRSRLERRFPHADARGISWAVVREILQLEPGTDPIPR